MLAWKNSKRRASETFQGQLLGTSLPGCRPGRYLQRFCNTDRSGYGFCFLRAFVSLFIYKTISVKELIPLCAESVKHMAALPSSLLLLRLLAVSLA